MILIFVNKRTSRLEYIFQQIFYHHLNTDIKLTTSIEEFISFEGMRMSYTENPLGNELHFNSHQLLFQEGVSDVDIHINWIDDVPYFFYTGKNSAIPYDIFAASFYLLSRYEEYLPHIKDEHQRFLSTESIATKNGFEHLPVVDIWVHQLKIILEKSFDCKLNIPKFEHLSIIACDVAYNYIQKGLVRTMGGICRDIYELNFIKIYHRLLCNFNFQKDPYDNFNFILNTHNEKQVKSIFFFLLGDYSVFDKSISIYKKKFISIIKNMADYVDVGLYASYASNMNNKKLKIEIKRLKHILNRDIFQVKQYYNKLHLTYTYRTLLKNNIQEDYSMGYNDAMGFRAGTSKPFYFYDLGYETTTVLKVFPFAVSDEVIKNVMNLKPQKALSKIKKIIDSLAKIDGMFTTVWHNKNISDYKFEVIWRNLYLEIIEYAKKYQK